MILDYLYNVAEKNGYKVEIFYDSNCVNVTNEKGDFCFTPDDNPFETNCAECIAFIEEG